MSSVLGTLARPRLAGLALVALLAAAGALLIATLRGLEPLPATLDMAGDEAPTRFVDRNGVPLNISYTAEWNVHDQLTLPEIPAFLREAFIHAEDKRFRTHGGPDWLARLSAIATNLRHLDSIRGASTISEQVVRMLNPRPRTVWTRWLEGFEAARLERRFSKDEILAFYLNQVPYAANRHGVRQAAELYFARDLATLSDREMLALAVLVRSPTRLDLRRYPEASEAAIGRLADLMLERGAIDAGRHDAILAGEVEIAESGLAVSAPHFLSFARERAEGLAAGSPTAGAFPAASPRAGGRVVTTLDAALQARVQGLLDTRLAALADLNVGQGAVLVADHATGEVLAWVVAGGGGAEGPEFHIDPVTTRRQPGSAQKPLLYALALERGATLADIVVDAPLTEDVGDGLHRYRNYSERYYGPVTLREALANSLNIPALKLLHGIGPAEYLQFMSRLGVTSLEAHPEMYGDGLALGNGEVTLYELVQAYAVLGNRGRSVELAVLRDDIAPRGTRGAAIVSPETASLIADALSDAEARAAEFNADSVLNLPVQTAVKTGTSSDYRDAWAVGFDARFTVGIWMGNLGQAPMGGITGSIGPALLLRSVFAELNRDGRTAPLYLSPRLTRRDLCLPSPRVAPGTCLERGEWFDPAHGIPARADPALAASATARASTSAAVTTPAARSGAQPTATARPAATPAIRFRQPTDGLELAFDPRLPAESQAFRFLLDGVSEGDTVAWSVDGITATSSGPGYVWPVKRGPHRVTAEISRAGETIARLDQVEFIVR